MPPPLELPTIQNWSCHNCGGCCRQHAIEITEAERQRITAQNWTGEDGIPPGQPLFVRLGLPGSRRYRLGHQADGACVFLDERGLCRIHAKFGEQAKPLACRIYPYAFHPAGRKITVSLRFSCPSVAGNRGRPVTSQEQELKALEKLVVPEGAERMPPPEISRGEKLEWLDTLKVVEQLDEFVAFGPGGVALRLVRALKFVDLLAQASFEKVRGDRLDEFLEIISEAAAGDVPNDLATIPEPSPTGRMQFRLLCAQYARRDTFDDRQTSWRSRWKLLLSALRFTRGTGLTPRLHSDFSEVPFSELERPFGPHGAEAEEMLIRYLRVKIQGLHFCGPAYYHLPLTEGFQSLALVLPVVLWLARWLAVGQGRTSLEQDDVARALSLADHHHGYSPAFGQRGFRSRVRLLARLDDMTRLIAWYNR